LQVQPIMKNKHLAKYGYGTLHMREETAAKLLKELAKMQVLSGGNKKMPTLSDFLDLLVTLYSEPKVPPLVLVTKFKKQVLLYDTKKRIAIVVARDRTGNVVSSPPGDQYLAFVRKVNPALFDRK